VTIDESRKDHVPGNAAFPRIGQVRNVGLFTAADQGRQRQPAFLAQARAGTTAPWAALESGPHIHDRIAPVVACHTGKAAKSTWGTRSSREWLLGIDYLTFLMRLVAALFGRSTKA
jgi:hypothetical protein